MLAHLVATGDQVHKHTEAARQLDEAARQYIRAAAGSSSTSAAEEITRLADLRDRGVISEAEFQPAKTKALT